MPESQREDLCTATGIVVGVACSLFLWCVAALAAVAFSVVH